MELKEGDVLAEQYTVKELCHGGFSEVAIVEDLRGPRRAIKRIREDKLAHSSNTEQIANQFINECYTWQTLKNCPYIAEAILAFRDFGGLGPVLFMEVVDGPSLYRLQADRRLSMVQTARVGVQIAKAMRCAHEQGILHRDLKPSNVLLTKSNDVKLIDWGLCSVGGVAGLDGYTAGYVSPQREAKPQLVDKKDDVYAYGTILYECLTGRLPSEVDKDILKNNLIVAEKMLPDSFIEIIVNALSFDPNERPDFEEIVNILGDESFQNDLQKREIERPFCSICGFVSINKIRQCPICGADCKVRTPGTVQKRMIRIPASSFTHGLNNGQAERVWIFVNGRNPTQEQVNQLVGDGQKQIFLPAFDIDEFPVTNTEFDEFCKTTNYPEPEGLDTNKRAYPNHPVVNVTWKDALCYALWKGKRLPSPMEWEKAARGDKDERLYPWGQNWDENRCNNANKYLPTNTTDVKKFMHDDRDGSKDGRSPFGVVNMVGNVKEWVSEGKNRKMRGLRGGGWTQSCILEGLVTTQIEADIDYHDVATGFRCAADIRYEIVFID